MLPIVVGSVIYVYQIPIKKYLAQRKLYELLEKDYRIERSDIQIDNIIRDTKSARGGVLIRFKVKNSPYLYDYDYSFSKKNWIQGYTKDGVYHNTEEIAVEEK
jgi:hypothetical protein